MRTDVKIGVAVGLLFVVAVVAYYVVFGTNGSADPNAASPELARTDEPGGERATAGRDGGVDANRVSLPRFGGLGRPSEPPVTPAIRETPSAEAPVTPAIRETPSAEPPVTPAIRETPSAEPPVTPAIRETPSAEPPVTPVIREAPSTERPIVPVVVPRTFETQGPTLPPMPALPGRERTYVVKKGDAGFWAIAEKAYGDGRHWTLIAKANPGADSNSLRPGQKLKIPPKPVPTPVRSAAAGASGLIVTPTGQRQYVVQKGDAGFWGIAQKVYGNGKHWTVIAEANPKVNSSRLKPGNRLAIPPQPTARVRRPTSVPTVLPGIGQKLYVVQASDTSGFSGIARKLYGDSKYWPLLAKANASAASRSLRAGQKLVVPELTDEIRRAMTRAPSTRSAPRRVADIPGRPVFD